MPKPCFSFHFSWWRLSIVAMLISGTAEAAVSDLCVTAAQEAAAVTGVPIQVLLAVTLTETGREGADGLSPWPWALNRSGESVWPQSKEGALAAIEEIIRAGTTNIDVGCFQLNYHWHGAAFPSVSAMLDPKKNALYAAGHLRDLYQKRGDWIEAAGAYHSATPDHAKRYLSRYMPIYTALQNGNGIALREAEYRENFFPLLQAGGLSAPGSLVPLDGPARPLIGG